MPTRLIVHADIYHEPVGRIAIGGGRAGIDEFLRYKTVSIVEPQ